MGRAREKLVIMSSFKSGSWAVKELPAVHDFAGDDGNDAGENVVVIGCGAEEGVRALIKRYTRLKSEQASFDDYPVPRTPPMSPRASLVNSFLVTLPVSTNSFM